MRRFRETTSILSSLVKLLPVAVTASHCSGRASGPPLPTCAPLDYVVTPGTSENPGGGEADSAPFRSEGDRIYFASRNGIYTAESGVPRLAVSLTAEVATRPDGTSVELERDISAFWVEPTRFIAVSRDGVWSLPRDGTPAAQIVSFARYTAVLSSARDDAFLYVVSNDLTWHLDRLPLAGGQVDEIATFSSIDSVPDSIYVDTSRLYAVFGPTISAFMKTPSGSSDVPLPRTCFS
jgi:hypothetical protein